MFKLITCTLLTLNAWSHLLAAQNMAIEMDPTVTDLKNQSIEALISNLKAIHDTCSLLQEKYNVDLVSLMENTRIDYKTDMLKRKTAVDRIFVELYRNTSEYILDQMLLRSTNSTRSFSNVVVIDTIMSEPDRQVEKKLKFFNESLKTSTDDLMAYLQSNASSFSAFLSDEESDAIIEELKECKGKREHLVYVIRNEYEAELSTISDGISEKMSDTVIVSNNQSDSMEHRDSFDYRQDMKQLDNSNDSLAAKNATCQNILREYSVSLQQIETRAKFSGFNEILLNIAQQKREAAQLKAELYETLLTDSNQTARELILLIRFLNESTREYRELRSRLLSAESSNHTNATADDYYSIMLDTVLLEIGKYKKEYRAERRMTQDLEERLFTKRRQLSNMSASLNFVIPQENLTRIAELSNLVLQCAHFTAVQRNHEMAEQARRITNETQLIH